MSKHRQLKIAAGIAVSFTSLVVIILYLLVKKVVSFEMAMLMLIALLGLYFGFGVLIAVYRFIAKLE